MFKKLFTTILILVASIGYTQQSVVTWETKISPLENDEYLVTLKANIGDHWHLYSQNIPDEATIPTSFSFENQKDNYQLIGKTEETKPIVKMDVVFGMELPFFEHEATFTQKIKLLNKELKFIDVIAAYQVCDDRSCIFEQGEGIRISMNGEQQNSVKPNSSFSELSNHLKINLKNTTAFLKIDNTSNGGGSWFQVFILGFLGGLIALLTPCVFPMIPLTVSFFTKNNNGIKNAILYGFFIILIYFLLSLPFHLIDSLDPEILNNISTNVWLNIFFFGIFLFFAFSFFGYYEITLPSKWGNQADTASTSGGLIGIFFMAITLAIVSFSCTGPILGSLLVGSLSADGGATQLSFGMVGFGTALALPFTIFALFPNLLNNLPKSGGWLNTVKVTLGFLEVALALKFLSNADLVQHWGLLKREVFLGIWIVVFIGLTLYLFGKIKFPHDSPIQKLSKTRIGIALVSGTFTLYLISGLFFNTNLNLLSGFPPPQFYSLKSVESECPLGLECYKDFNEGLQVAKETNKPIMLDFTGWACVNCRKMEENVWTNPRVHSELSKYVIISLYVDDDRELPKSEQFEYVKENGNIKHIKTIGSKWATFQTVNFKTASQPYYVLISPDLELLNHPIEYTDTNTYLNWLKTGSKNFK